MQSYFKDIYPFLCHKHPNQKIYLISDHHFFHSNIIKYQRPFFNDIFSMNQFIIKKHNEVVGKDDVVLFLGDFSFRKNEIKGLLKQMNGKKYLILGNHDNDTLSHNYSDLGFECVFTVPVKMNEDFLSHYPLNSEEFQDINSQLLRKEFFSSSGINYHGHIHYDKSEDKRFINVSCEMQDYKPFLWGNTKQVTEDKKPWIIDNPDLFQKILEQVYQKYQLPFHLVLLDYFYSILLDSISRFANEIFIYGSYPLYKKYRFISNFSDLDVCLIYQENMSKNKNMKCLQQMFHVAFSFINQIANIDLKIDKKMRNIGIFQLCYKNPYGNEVKTYFDSNLVPLNIYCDNDFVFVNEKSVMEEYLLLQKEYSNYRFPNYQAQFLTPTGDMANLILQILFQQDFLEKKQLAIKKLKWVYRMSKNESVNYEQLENTLIRFFIRNVFFFYTMNRRKDFECFQEKLPYLEAFLKIMPNDFSYVIANIFNCPNSMFSSFYNEMIHADFDSIPNKAQELIRTLK